MAKTIMDMLKSRDVDGAGSTTSILHAVNPQEARWAHLLPHLQERLGLGTIPLQEWIRMVMQDDLDPDINPAAKLADSSRVLQILMPSQWS